MREGAEAALRALDDCGLTARESFLVLSTAAAAVRAEAIDAGLPAHAFVLIEGEVSAASSPVSAVA